MAGGNQEIFSFKDDIDATEHLDGIGQLRAKAGFDIGLAVTAEADACNGLNLALGAELDAAAQAAVSMYLRLAAGLQLEAAAGVNLQAQIKGDIFDEFGILADIGAFAKAQAAALLEIGLSIEELKQLFQEESEQLLGSAEAVLAQKIFDDFLDQLEVKAGVLACASFSAMVHGYCNIYGSFSDPEKSGFFIEAGGGAGLEVGFGADFFTAARIKSPAVFYKKAALELLHYLDSKVAAEFPEHAGEIKIAAYAFVVLGGLTFVAWQIHNAWFGATSAPEAKKAVQALMDSYRIMILHAIKDNAAAINRAVIHAVVEQLLSSDEYSPEDKASIEESLLDIVSRIETEKYHGFTAVNKIVSDAADILARLLPEHRSRMREPLTILWCSAALVHALSMKEPGKTLLKSINEDSLSLPDAPAIVRGELSAALGMERPLHNIPVSEAFDYLFEYLAGRAVHQTLPQDLPAEWQPLMEILTEQLGLSGGALVSALLYANIGGELTDTRLYKRLRGILKALLEKTESDLMGHAGLLESDDPIIKEYMTYTVLPSLKLANEFLLGQMDDLIEGRQVTDPDRFRQALSVLVYRIIAKTVITFTLMLQDYVDDQVQDALDTLIQQLDGGGQTPILTQAAKIAEDLSAGLVQEDRLEEATKRLLIDLFTLAKRLQGEEVWSQGRRRQRRKLLEDILVGKDMLPRFFETGSVEDYLDLLMDCYVVPNEEELRAFSILYGKVMADQIKLVLDELPPILSDFFVTLSTGVLEEAQERLEEVEEALREAAEDLRIFIENLQHRIERLEEELASALVELKEQLEDLKDYLDSDELLEETLEALHDLGLALIEGSNHPRNWKDAEKAAFELAWAATTAEGIGPLRMAVASGLWLLKPIIEGVVTQIQVLLEANLDEETPIILDVKDMLAANIKAAFQQQMGGYSLPSLLTPENTADIVSSLLVSKLTAFDAASQKQTAVNLKKSRRRERQEELDRNLAMHETAMRTIEAEILSPVDASRHRPFLYGGQVDISIFVKRGTLDMLESNRKRIFLYINGVELKTRKSDWQETRGGLSYSKRLGYTNRRSGLKPGLNVIECSVTNLEPPHRGPGIGMTGHLHDKRPPRGGDRNRRSAAFYLDPSAPLQDTMRVDASLSQFNVPDKNDHLHAREEFVTFVNHGQSPLDLGGWVVSDAKEHLYVFPDGTIVEPGKSIRIVTGRGQNTASEFFMGRRAAIWNNRGDTVLLIDKEGMVHSSFVY